MTCQQKIAEADRLLAQIRRLVCGCRLICCKGSIVGEQINPFYPVGLRQSVGSSNWG
jgi:hypothetical protein